MSCSSSSRLLLPRRAPASGVFAAVERDTRALALSDAERFNYYPATPLAVVSWIFEGVLHPVQMVGTATGEPALSAPLPRLTLAGPQRRPRASWAPGPVHALSVAFRPEDLARLTGVRGTALMDGIAPLAEVASRAFLDACLSVFEGSDAGPFARVENALAPLWRDARPAAPAPFLGEWLRGLAGRAVLSGAGQGLRQVQRRIKAWTGQSHRDLQRYSRVEDAMARMSAHRRDGGIDWAGLAGAAGFADQSHLGREVRRVTGLSPARLEARIAQDEAFWFYRLLGEHVRRP
ncbi:helix-turn-helix domain-containing protein [Achromobacter xylosoxidans]